MRTIIIAFLKRPWWQQILAISLALIFYIQLSGYIGTKLLVPMIGWSGGIHPAGEKADSLEGRFVRWDSYYYLNIAQNGYQPDGTEKAFFPLYPLLTYLLSNLLDLSLLWSGLLVSVLCFIVACLLMYQWVLIDYNSQIALWSAIWICIFPMAFFFVAFYAEALFLLTCIASIYFARRGQFIASGFAIALAGATRPPAFLLAVPYLIEFWQQHNFHRTQVLRFILGALIAPLGMLGYLSFLGLQSERFDLLAIYSSNQAAEWKRLTTWPWITLYDGINAAIFGTGIRSDWFSRSLVWQDLTYAILGVVSAIWALFNIRLSAAIFLLISMLFFYTNHGPYGYAFWSVPRHVAALFPIYLILALWTIKLPYRYRWLPPAVSLGLLGILAAWFAIGRWVA